jgi:O-antigen ligase
MDSLLKTYRFPSPEYLVITSCVVMVLAGLALDNPLLLLAAALLPLALLFSLLILKYPHLALVGIICIYMIGTEIKISGVSLNPLLVGMCGLAMLLDRKRFPVRIDRKFAYFLLLYIATIVVSYAYTWSSIDFYEINIYINNFIILLLMFSFNSEEKIETCYKAIVWCSFVLVMLGLYQLWTVGMPAGGMRAHYPNHVVYALHIAWGIPFSFYFFRNYRRKLYLLVGMVQIAGVILALSRGVLLSLALAVLLSLLVFSFARTVQRSRLRYLGLLLLALGIGAAVLVVTVHSGYRSLEEQEINAITSNRTILYRAGIEMFKQHPVFGVGWEAYKETWSGYIYLPRPRYGGYFGDQKLNPHSSYLKIITELGIFGLLLYLAFNYFLLRSVARVFLLKEGKPLLIILLTYYLLGLVDNNAYGNERMFFFVAGLLYVLRLRNRESSALPSAADGVVSSRNQKDLRNFSAATGP